MSSNDWQERIAKEREEITSFLKEIGQEYPSCGYYIGNGWKPHVEKALREIAKVGIPWRLAQVKQKFCELRIYIDFLPDVLSDGHDMFPNDRYWEEDHPLYSKYKQVSDIIGEVEYKCSGICESCGLPAKRGMRMGNKLCDACKEESDE